MLVVWIVVVIILAVLVWCISRPDRSSEGFTKVLGTLGKQKQLYYRCLGQCERSDPNKHMAPTHGSMACLEYCDSMITDIARRGGSTYYEDLPVASAVVIDRADESYLKCGDGSHGARCREMYATDGEIDEKCRQECQYTSMPVKECMWLCAGRYEGNKSLGWSWK